MSDFKKIPMRDQRQSVVDAFQVQPDSLQARFMGLFGNTPEHLGAPPTPELPQANPSAIEPTPTLDDSPQNPLIAAKLAAVEQERQRQRDIMAARLQTANKARTEPMGQRPALETYPAEE